jgi:radical SAM-linked protein
LASALPLGITSECEILDVSLREPVALDGLEERITSVSPVGLAIYVINEVPVRSPALQTLVRSAEYRIHFEDSIDTDHLRQKAAALLASETIATTRERKGKPVTSNIRPLIYNLSIDGKGDLIAHLAVGDQGNVRPDEVLRQMGFDGVFYTVHRFRLHLENG